MAFPSPRSCSRRISFCRQPANITRPPLAVDTVGLASPAPRFVLGTAGPFMVLPEVPRTCNSRRSPLPVHPGPPSPIQLSTTKRNCTFLSRPRLPSHFPHPERARLPFLAFHQHPGLSWGKSPSPSSRSSSLKPPRRSNTAVTTNSIPPSEHPEQQTIESHLADRARDSNRFFRVALPGLTVSRRFCDPLEDRSSSALPACPSYDPTLPVCTTSCIIAGHDASHDFFLSTTREIPTIPCPLCTPEPRPSSGYIF